MSTPVSGTVKWFNSEKGFGFLSVINARSRQTLAEKQQEDGEDVFVHHTAITMDGFRELKQDERVEFEIVDGPKGPQAGNVKRIG